MRRDLEVVGSGLVLEHAASQVESRAVAGAEETTLPVVGQRGLGTGGELVARRAAQVGADTDGHKDLGLDRARAVLGVRRRREGGALGIRVGKLGLVLL